jgi:hypothetical protein
MIVPYISFDALNKFSYLNIVNDLINEVLQVLLNISS